MLNLTETCCEVEDNGMTCLYYSIIHRTLKTQIIFCLNLTFQDQLAKQFWSLIVQVPPDLMMKWLEFQITLIIIPR